MTEETAGQYVEETTVEGMGDGMVLGFGFCNPPASSSDTTNLCVGDEIFAETELTGNCQYGGTEDAFTFHCESVVNVDVEGADCTMSSVFEGIGTRTQDGFETTLTWTYSLEGPDCEGSCTVTFTSTATRIGEPVCSLFKATRRVPLIRLPAHAPK